MAGKYVSCCYSLSVRSPPQVHVSEHLHPQLVWRCSGRLDHLEDGSTAEGSKSLRASPTSCLISASGGLKNAGGVSVGASCHHGIARGLPLRDGHYPTHCEPG